MKKTLPISKMKLKILILILTLSGCTSNNISSEIISIKQCRQNSILSESQKCITDLALKSRIFAICEFSKKFASDCQKEYIKNYPEYQCSSDECHFLKANTLFDCQKIEVEALRVECQTQFYQKQEGMKFCQSLGLERNENLCLAGLSANLKDYQICENIEKKDENMIFIKNCYTRVAKTLKNSSICQKIDKMEDRIFCEYTVEVEKGDYSICDKTELTNPIEENYKIQCNLQSAIKKGDLEICDNIDTQNYKFQCLYQTMVQNDLMPEKCELINKNPDLRNECLLTTARTKKDCAQIENQDYQKTCLANIKLQELDLVN